MTNNIYDYAKQTYAAMGIDTDAAIEKLLAIPLAIHCWQGDDVGGFDSDVALSGGIQTTGNYPGKARTPEQLMQDFDVAISNVGGKLKLNLHACYAIFEDGEYADRDALQPKHFAKWVAYAKEKGMFVIADIKRGDIGSTATAYAEGWLSGAPIEGQLFKSFDADCVTLNGYMGGDSIKPFLDAAKTEDKCVFVLVKTSNPGSGQLQDVRATGRSVYEVMGDLNEIIATGTEGKYGYTMAGAVTGATYPADIEALRKRLSKTFFLVPGYGAQGGTAADVKFAFDQYGHGAIVNSSRGIMCAWQKTGNEGRDFAQAARNAAIAMRDDIAQFVTIE